MKKTIVLGLAVVMALAASVTAYANASNSCTEIKHSEGIHVEVASQGYGPCSLCKCSGFTQRPGYYQCWCGHQRFSHK